ncbi:MAG: hypothetical protein ACOX87_12510 [Chloroflexota bacterium]|jgi:hypothetical protein
MPTYGEGSNGWFLSHLAHDDRLPDATRAALLRDHLSLFARSGVFLVTLVHPMSRKLFEELGFELLPNGRNRGWGGVYDVEVGMLDIARIGIETWLEAMLGGRPLPKALSLVEVEQALQEAFLHWREDRYLAQSPLAQLRIVPFVERDKDRPNALRRAILGSLATASNQATPHQQEAYRALELAYIQRTSSQEKAAERMNVSRTTFYRLIKRGIQGLATSMVAAESHPRGPDDATPDTTDAAIKR